MVYIKRIIAGLVFLLVVSTSLAAADDNSVKDIKDIPKDQVLPEFPQTSFIVSIGGSFFDAIFLDTTVNSFISPSWSARATVRYRRPGKLLGLSFDIHDSFQPDYQTNGGYNFLHFTPNITINLTPLYWLSFQFRAGPGLTVTTLADDQAGTINYYTSVDFTLSVGAAVLFTISDHYVLGIEADFYIVFEQQLIMSYAVGGFIGYRF